MDASSMKWHYYLHHRWLLFKPSVITSCTISLLIHRKSRNLPVSFTSRKDEACRGTTVASHREGVPMKLKRPMKIKWPGIDVMRFDELLDLNKTNSTWYWVHPRAMVNLCSNGGKGLHSSGLQRVYPNIAMLNLMKWINYVYLPESMRFLIVKEG